MRSALLATGLLVAAAVVLALAWPAPSLLPAADIAYTQRLGTPRAHSPHGRLPELAMEIVYDQARGRILTRQENGEIVAWDLASAQARTLARTKGLFGYCPARQQLLLQDAEGAWLMDLEAGTRQTVGAGPYRYAAWSEDCQRFVLAGEEDRSAEVCSAEGPARIATLETVLPLRNGLALSANGRHVATAEGGYDDSEGHRTVIEVFAVDDRPASRRIARLAEPGIIAGMWRIAFSPDGAGLFLGTQAAAESGLRRLESDGGGLVWGQDGFAAYWVRGLAVSPDGRLLASGDETGRLVIWDAQSGQKLHETHTGLVIQSLAFSDDGTRLAVSLWDSTLGLVDLPPDLK